MNSPAHQLRNDLTQRREMLRQSQHGINMINSKNRPSLLKRCSVTLSNTTYASVQLQNSRTPINSYQYPSKNPHNSINAEAQHYGTYDISNSKFHNNNLNSNISHTKTDQLRQKFNDDKQNSQKRNTDSHNHGSKYHYNTGISQFAPNENAYTKKTDNMNLSSIIGSKELYVERESDIDNGRRDFRNSCVLEPNTDLDNKIRTKKCSFNGHDTNKDYKDAMRLSFLSNHSAVRQNKQFDLQSCVMVSKQLIQDNHSNPQNKDYSQKIEYISSRLEDMLHKIQKNTENITKLTNKQNIDEQKMHTIINQLRNQISFGKTPTNSAKNEQYVKLELFQKYHKEIQSQIKQCSHQIHSESIIDKGGIEEQIKKYIREKSRSIQNDIVEKIMKLSEELKGTMENLRKELDMKNISFSVMQLLSQNSVKNNKKGNQILRVQTNTSVSYTSAKQEPKNYQMIYHIDQDGFLLDHQQKYILDKHGKSCKLNEQHLQLLRKKGIIISA